MSTRIAFEQHLSRLIEIRIDPTVPGAAEELAAALGVRSNLLVAQAAGIISEWELTGYEAAMARSFDYFMVDAIRRDPTCAAKYALADALVKFDYQDEELFRRGIRHVQPEPVYGGHEDTATRLRAVCALGYIRLAPSDGLLELASLLMDRETDARLGAVRAIAHAGSSAAAPLLWYKVLAGDSEASVYYECFAALLLLVPERALPFAGGYLAAPPPAVAEAAALALGDSHLPEALAVLREGYDRSDDPAVRRTILRAIADLRTADSFAFLLDRLESESPMEAQDALDALAAYRDDLRRWRKVERILARR